MLWLLPLLGRKLRFQVIKDIQIDYAEANGSLKQLFRLFNEFIIETGSEKDVPGGMDTHEGQHAVLPRPLVYFCWKDLPLHFLLALFKSVWRMGLEVPEKLFVQLGLRNESKIPENSSQSRFCESLRLKSGVDLFLRNNAVLY